MIKTYKKAVITGQIVEIIEYEKLNVNAKGGFHERNEESEQKESNYKQQQRKRKNMIRRLASTNFNNESKFITLTFAENITDIQYANWQFKQYIQRLNYRVGKQVEYLAVIEFQKRGAIHYHMLCNIPYFSARAHAEIWGNGFIKINRIRHVDNVGAYIVKYMSKENDMRLSGKKAYLASRNLVRPDEYASWKERDTEIVTRIASDLENSVPAVYERTYESEHAGKIVYKQYNIQRTDKQEKLIDHSVV